MKTRDVRKMLCNALSKAERGEMPIDEAKTIIGLANQIQASLATECKVAAMKMRLGSQADSIGDLSVTE